MTLGYVESELTLGKQMSKEGEMKHNQEIKDVSIKSMYDTIREQHFLNL